MRNLILIPILALLLSGCGDTFKGKAVAEPQIAVFHERLDAGRYEEIYAAANDDFRKAAPKEKVLQLFSAIGKKLGKVKSSATKSWNVKTFNLVTTVVFGVETQFEQGTATETFTFRVAGDQATLVGYNINSLDMMSR